MTKCRQLCTRLYTRSGRQIPPVITQQAASVMTSSSDSARGIGLTFSTAMVLDVLQEIMTETVFPDGLVDEACGRFLEGHSEVILRSINQ